MIAFFCVDSVLNFYTFFIVQKFTIKFCFYNIANLFPNFNILVKNFYYKIFL